MLQQRHTYWCHTLMELSLNDNISLNELAEQLHLDKSPVSRTVDSLVQSGLVDREIPVANRRTTRIRLPDKGRSVCITINAENNQYFTQALSAIPSEKLADFLQLFEQLTNEIMRLNKK